MFPVIHALSNVRVLILVFLLVAMSDWIMENIDVIHAQDPPADAPAAGQDPPADAPAEGNDLLGDDLLGDDLLGDDLLDGSPEDSESDADPSPSTEEIHAEIFAASNFPSADECALCHPVQYKQWSVSQHAYSQLSPLMMSMQNAMNAGTSSTNGDFCLRCHGRSRRRRHRSSSAPGSGAYARALMEGG